MRQEVRQRRVVGAEGRFKERTGTQTVTVASQSESAPLVEMMLESAREEAEAGAYEYAVEYVLAVIAVEPNLVLPRLLLQDLALSLLSSQELHEPYINPV